MELVIRSEAEAWAALERATHGDFIDGVQLKFDGWPVFKMDVKGRDWNSTVPTRIMSPLLDIQKDINRAYTTVRYGEANLRKLRDEDRDELEVVVKVREGSSLFDAELWKQFSTIAEAAVGRMDGNQVVITVLGLGLLVTAPVMYRAWLASRQREKELEHQIELSRQENARLEIFAKAVQRQPMLGESKESIQATQNRMLKVAKTGDVIAMSGVPVRAEEAEVLVQAERERSEDMVIQGEFFLLGNRTDKGEGFRITVRRVHDGLTIQADVPIQLPHDQQRLIQRAEWQKERVVLVMNATQLRGVVSQAVVISAEAIPSEDANDTKP